MKDIIVWGIHTPAGTIALVAAAAGLLTNKGSNIHRKAGRYFTISMLIMLISGFVAALIKESIDDMFLSTVVIYTVFTAWLTPHHKNNETGLLEHLALGWILAIAIAAFFMQANSNDPFTPSIYLFWAGFAVMCAFGDVGNLLRAGISGKQRIIRHVWRIGFSLVWAALALADKIVKMLGSNVNDLPQEQLLYIVAVPTILILLVVLYWIVNIWFFSRNKFASYGR